MPHLSPFLSFRVTLEVLVPSFLRRGERPVAGMVLTDAVLLVVVSTGQLGRLLHLVGGAADGVGLLLLFGTSATAASLARFGGSWTNFDRRVGGTLLIEADGLKMRADPFSPALQDVVDLLWSGA